MSKAEIQMFLTSLGRSIVSSPISDLPSLFEQPLPIYAPDNLIVLQGEDMIEEEVHAFQLLMHRLGIARIAPQRVQVLDYTNRRALVRATWVAYNAGGFALWTLDAQHVLRRDTEMHSFRLELIDCLGRAVPVDIAPHLSFES